MIADIYCTPMIFYYCTRMISYYCPSPAIRINNNRDVAFNERRGIPGEGEEALNPPFSSGAQGFKLKRSNCAQNVATEGGGANKNKLKTR